MAAETISVGLTGFGPKKTRTLQQSGQGRKRPLLSGETELAASFQVE